MFVGSGGDIEAMRHLQTEDMFEIVRNPRGVAVAPLGEYFKTVGEAPVVEAMEAGIDAGFLGNLAAGGIDQLFVVLAAAGYGLPEAGVCGALQQQDVEGWCVDDDEYRNRLFMVVHASGKATIPRT